MDIYSLSAIILTIAIFIGYLNHRFIGMQSTIAIMTGSLVFSSLLLILGHLGIADITDTMRELILKADFRDLLLKGMLSYLLFAGALSIDLDTLKSHKWEIGTLASVSTIASALLIGMLSYYLLPLAGIHIPLLYCLLFGALISPTDPIAVLATFKSVDAPKSLSVCVAGESLFNDGVGIVIFTTLFQLTFQHGDITFGSITILFLKQAVGGLLYGFLLGVIALQLIRPVKDHKIAILVTIGIVSGGYSFASWLDISGPLAMVVSGIFLGNKLRHSQCAKGLVASLDTFWELIDEILNAVLFLLIGFELLAIKASGIEVLVAALAIPFVLLIRLITVALPMKLIQLRRSHNPFIITILTWGGLRGGLAVALALSLPANPYREFLLAMTYAIVAFAVIVQGLTVAPLVRLSKKYASK